jgi:endonuclease YncB( thermonuclease family)
LGTLGVFDGVGQVIPTKQLAKKLWISSWLGGTWIDCALDWSALMPLRLQTANGKDGQPLSRQSTQHLASLVLNKTVDVKSYGADRNGRTLGGVFFLNGINVNIAMLQAGLAEVYRGKPASGHDMGPYWKAENDAKAASQGMWVLGEKYVSPREWRKERRS